MARLVSERAKAEVYTNDKSEEVVDGDCHGTAVVAVIFEDSLWGVDILISLGRLAAS
jgi:hypothetical protein